MIEDLQVRITAIKQNTGDSKSFYLEPLTGALTYKAGQFITFMLEIDGKEVRRSYSFSSTPGIDPVPFVTIKRIQNGYISRHLFDHAQEGDVLDVLPPGGRFVLEETGTAHQFFIAAGTGITPIFSLIKSVLHHHHSKVTLVNQNTDEHRSMFRNELLLLKQQYPNRFTLVELFSQPLNEAIAPRRLNNWVVEQLLQQYAGTTPVHFYLCGPIAFMQMVYITLRFIGYVDDQVSRENFTVSAVPPPPLMTDVTPKTVGVHLKNEYFRFPVAYPQNILQAALMHGVVLPYSCRGGRCSTCAAICKTGRVKMSINEVLTERDLRKGLVLTCVAFAETDVELDFNLHL
ncbi:ferredoxin--NADP reductase [Segetibacter sp. 3557_3]|uniref:ferredoxin--NADP reductase n=1 Tax=Segetibacter sp. 3557_3 TaxID=2547429 RepID=UPI0010591427|nr:ferredoxin--NADP reductase [Segetibacter sp. 3557_3]TDH27502.1 ferredoxin--NADP reductase [Segetibacter sp. 3557_3]